MPIMDGGAGQRDVIAALKAAGWTRLGYDTWISTNGQTWPNWMHAYCILCHDKRRGVKHG